MTDHSAENDRPCTPESPACEAHKGGRSWLLTCPPPRPSPPGETDDGMANDCTHGSATGVDTTPVSDPGKVWRCDHCGLRWREGGGPILPPGTSTGGEHRG